MTDLATRPGPAAPQAPPPPRPGPLGRLARLAHRRRGTVVLAWIAALGLALGLTSAFGGQFTADYSAPGSDSSAAADLIEERFPGLAGTELGLVVHADSGIASVRDDVEALLREVGAAPHVAGVEDPFATPGAISADGRTLLATVRLDVDVPDDMPVADSLHIVELTRAAEAPGMQVAVGGEPVYNAERGEIGSEGIGLIAALVILLLMFGSVVAAGLPLVVAVAGLAVSSALTRALIALVDAPDWSTSLATMIGIGIGIDYVLLMVTRFREWRVAGLDPEAATVATLDTAGRSVLVAGTTVVVSMLGLFGMGLSFMRGAALVTILGVVVVVTASLTLFPALLGYLGRHVDRLRLPLRRSAPAAGHRVEGRPGRGWQRWSAQVQRHRVLATVAGVGILLAFAAPFLGVRFGFPDAGNGQEHMSTRQAHDLVADGFGPGANGPLVLAVDLAGADGEAALAALGGALPDVPGIAAVTPPRVDATGRAALLTVVPETGPQEAATEDLVHRLREDLPQTLAGTGAEVHVGGATAASLDSTANTASRLPLLIVSVVALSMLLLLVAFRSVAVAVQAAVMNLLSVAASYGVVALVLQGGWAGRLVGIDTETPLPAFVPVLMFAVLFGLSMDYEVFLVSRMREGWVRTGDSALAVTEGLAATARVITAAAAIMIAVFAAFVPSPDIVLKVIGIGMAAAILLDATVVRLLLLPAAMHLLGRATWWMPRTLERVLPELAVEGRPTDHLPAQGAAAVPAPPAAAAPVPAPR
ncbi:RND superfamily putative drug exporter [Kineococcus xinjiangensis]|uniref:RND superfamily putative drug exporter n=1 Tax=Kineococcus xinjiangensis TaxID=512762 RepID=A0A2S6IVI8_9ACTN|nr:MMPL family transporter [Kineococcus xinjiangensis]PPK98074.1 RND superfamily putative drug exporter [Kineococcus xinjiangensis]